MNGFLEKILFVAYLSIFIVDLVAANSHERSVDSTDRLDYKRVDSDASDNNRIFGFREGLVEWLSSQVNNDVAEIEANLKLNRSLEKKTCPSTIVFSYVESNKSLVLAECEAKWRRFVKQPTSLSPKQIANLKPNPEITDLVEVLVLNRDIREGESVKRKDLARKKLRVSDFSPFQPKLDEHSRLITSKDLIAGEPLAHSDILVGKRVLTAKSAIPSGSSLSKIMTTIDVRYQDIPSDALVNATGWAFMETNRTIIAGEIIRERYLRKAKLVRRKDPVTLVNNSSSIQIITSGIAMQDGYYGQSVKVINTESGRSVVGTVTGLGKVEINAAP